MDTGALKLFDLAECSQIVRNSLDLPADEQFQIESYHVARGSNDLVGFMGEYYKLHVYLVDKVAVEGNRHLNYFVKTVPISNEYHKQECERKGFFGKETRIYNEILPNVQRFASSQLYPKCYYTRSDLIVLEDLTTSAEGLRQLAPGEIYTLEHHRVVLRHQAKLHAASIAWESADNLNIGEKFADVFFEMQLTMNNEWYITGINGILFLAKMHPKFQSSDAQTFINGKLYKILADAERLTEPSQQWRNVLCHRDSWDRNIFFQYDKRGRPIDCRIVDFQLTRYSPPAIDVLFFLYVTTTAARRREIYTDCLDFYYDALQQNLRQLDMDDGLIAKSEFLADCQRARLAALILMGICEPLLKMPKGLSNQLRADEPEKFDFYMNSERSELFTRVMALDPDYRSLIMTRIEELLDYLLNSEVID